MVAIIKTGYSIQRSLLYNENKVEQGVAQCIGEGNYPVDVDQMTLNMKLNRFKKILVLNENIKRNSVHISLNFHPSENLSIEILMSIASTYMEKIGFGQQPYLVYQHHDSGHPHLHVLTTHVKEDANGINMSNIGRNQSYRASREIEISFGLVKAIGSKESQTQEFLPLSARKIQYGAIQSKKAIENVLSTVLTSYKYTSLPELNAVLQLYNVYANGGGENSRTFKNKGLTYHILDKNNKMHGVPIKASSLYNKPTLKFLEQQFVLNQNYHSSYQSRVRNTIDLAFLRQKQSLSELVQLLNKEGINTVFRKTKEGVLESIIYVDHTTKCVFSDQTLGAPYCVKAIQERVPLIPNLEQNRITATNEKTAPPLLKAPNQIGYKTTYNENFLREPTFDPNNSAVPLLEILTQSEPMPSYNPNQLKDKRIKKKRKGLTNNQ
jgi:hypothetical protein